MPRELSPELDEGFEILKTGEWVTGMRLLSGMGQRIAPGPAERWMRENMRDPDAYTRDELVAMGRRRQCQIRASNTIRSGRWESDPPELTRAHWQGDKPFKVRDRFPGAISVAEAAEVIGVSEAVLENWIDNGMAPEPLRVNEIYKGVRYVTPALLAIYRKIAEVYPGPGKMRWELHPHVFWKVPQPVHYCPSCGTGLTANLTLAPAATQEDKK